jgi:hypothetical protein
MRELQSGVEGEALALVVEVKRFPAWLRVAVAHKVAAPQGFRAS